MLNLLWQDVATTRSDARVVLWFGSMKRSVAETGPGKGKVSGGATRGMDRNGDFWSRGSGG